MKLLSRLRQIIMVSGVESFGVAVAGITGLLIVNVMPKDQYAVYTLLITCMQLILGITDLGLSKCCLPIVGQRNNEMNWVVGVARQIFRRRKLMLIVALGIVVPYGLYTFWLHDWFAWGYGLASAVIVIIVLLTLRGHYASIVLLILGHISTISRVSFFAATTRFALVSTVLFLPFASYSVACVFAAAAASEFISIVLYKRAFQAKGVSEIELSSIDQKRVDEQIMKIAVPLIPSAIFFQIQATVTIFLASLFGSADLLAEIGAFGRLAIALAIVDRVAGILLFPAIARAQAGSRLASQVGKVHITYLALMTCLLLTGIFLPHYWIFLLGEKYRSMEPYVWMMFLSTILMNAAGLAFMTLAVRGFTERQASSIVFVLILQITYLWIFGIADLPAVLWFNIVTCGAHFVYQYALLFFRWPDLGKQA